MTSLKQTEFEPPGVGESKGRERTVGALGRGVEEKDGLVDDTSHGASSAD